MSVNGPVATDFAGVIQALRDKGLDPGKVVSCVPSAGLAGHVPGVKGCNVYDKCPFYLTRYGGFQGHGPENIIYYHKPNDGTQNQQENEMACYHFVRLMLERMRAGIRDREQGKRGNPGPELINIIGGQGDKYRQKIWVKEDPNSKDPYARYVPKVIVKTCSVYRHPDPLLGDSFESQLERDAIKRMQADPDNQVGPPELPPPSLRMPMEIEEEEAMTLGEPAAPTPVAEPVKGKK